MIEGVAHACADIRARPQTEFSREGFPADYIAHLLGEEAAQAALLTIGKVNPAQGRPTLDFIGTWELMAANMRALGDETHGVASVGAPMGNFEMMCEAMLHADTLAAGLQRMSRFSKVMRTDMQVQSRVAHGALHVRGVSRSDFSVAREVYTDAFAFVLHMTLCWATGCRLAPMRVRSSKHLASAPGSALGLISPTVSWGHEGFHIVYQLSDARLYLVADDAGAWLDGAYRAFRSLVADLETERRHEHGVAGPVSRRVRQELITRPASQAETARSLGMSPATLRRKLETEGSSFRAISSVLKRETAAVLLATDGSTQDLAARLGMSDARSLRRACRLWFGLSPTQARAALMRGRLDGLQS